MSISQEHVGRFWSRVSKSDGCWVWTGAFSRSRLRGVPGYGVMRIGNQQFRANRLSYEINVGTIPRGLNVCHHCDNPACVRPDHLFLGTQKDNMVDRSAKGRAKTGKHDHRGEKNPAAKLTRIQAAEIRKLAQGRELPRKEIAQRYGISLQTICNIVKGRYWV